MLPWPEDEPLWPHDSLTGACQRKTSAREEKERVAIPSHRGCSPWMSALFKFLSGSCSSHLSRHHPLPPGVLECFFATHKLGLIVPHPHEVVHRSVVSQAWVVALEEGSSMSSADMAHLRLAVVLSHEMVIRTRRSG